MSRRPTRIDSPSPVRTPSETLKDDPTHSEYLTVTEAILTAIRIGATHADAAAYAGIAPPTLSVWLTRGANELARQATENTDNTPPTEEPYVNLYLDVSQVDASARIMMLVDWRRNMRKDWRAIDRFMAKRYGGVWADPNRRQIEVTGAGGGPLEIGVGPVPAMSHSDAAELGSVLALRAAELGALEAGEVIDVDSEVMEA